MAATVFIAHNEKTTLQLILFDVACVRWNGSRQGWYCWRMLRRWHS